MNAQSAWQIFLETGAPEMYLMYTQAKDMEKTDVFDHPGNRPESYKIQ